MAPGKTARNGETGWLTSDDSEYYFDLAAGKMAVVNLPDGTYIFDGK